MKKILALILSTLLAATVFVSCGNDGSKDNAKPASNKSGIIFEDVLEKTIAASADLDNYGMDMDIDLEMTMMGQTMAMDMSMDCEMDGKLLYMNMNTSMPALGQDMTTETYMDTENFVQYVLVEDEWYKTPMDEATIAAYKEAEGMQMDMSIYSEYMTEGTVKETKHNGVDCYEISGVVDIDYMEFLEKMNMDSLTGSLEEAGLPENFYEEIFKNVEPFVLVMGVEKETYLPVYCNIDMTDMMDALMSSVMGSMYEDMGMEIEIEIPKCIASAEYKDFGTVSVTLPSEVLNAEELEAY